MDNKARRSANFLRSYCIKTGCLYCTFRYNDMCLFTQKNISSGKSMYAPENWPAFSEEGNNA